MKENLLLLCMAYPEISRKYGASVCMAGITEDGGLRRIYPVPFEKFLQFGFHKREWINYDIREKGDYRKESYKIYPESIQHGLKVDYEEIRKYCEANKTTIEELKKKTDIDKTSLGIIKPKILGFKMEYAPIDDKKIFLRDQERLNGTKIPIDLIPFKAHYIYRCGDKCAAETPHKSLCLDTELYQLMRKLLDIMDMPLDDETFFRKVKNRFYDWMLTRDVYFIMGTHSFHPKSWMIISVLYPPKNSLKGSTLDSWVS